MAPSKPPPPMNRTRWFQLLGSLTSKASSGGISPRTVQVSGVVSVWGVSVACVIVAPSKARLRKLLHAACALPAADGNSAGGELPPPLPLPPQEASSAAAATTDHEVMRRWVSRRHVRGAIFIFCLLVGAMPP
ncbi:hypothetical protein D9M72_509140 [compost metagenome]